MGEHVETATVEQGGNRKLPNKRGLWMPTVSDIIATLALVVSVCSALYSSFTLSYQRKQFAQTAFLEYGKFRETSSGSILQCALFLLNHTTDTELKALLEGQPKFSQDLTYQTIPNFSYNRKRHAGLSDCVDEGEADNDGAKEIKALFKKYEWSMTEENDELRKVRGSIAGKVSKNINFLDIGLIGYRHGGGDKEVMCENFATYLDAGWRHQAVKYGILGRFIERLIKLELIREDNFPNIYAFTRELAEKTRDDLSRTDNSFTKPADCSEFRSYPGQELKEWFELRFLRVKAVGPVPKKLT